MYMAGVVREENERFLGTGVELLEQEGNFWRVNQLLYADDTVPHNGPQPGHRRKCRL